ncbi:MAG: TonB-dependent receptor domain-containing protein [Rhodospirillales bacterium]
MDNGNITGRITDPSGAVVVGAEVTVTNVQTNFETVTQTNADGIYRVQSLRPGPYRVIVTAAGFKRTVRENIELRAGDTMGVNAVLEVGTIAESVSVTAEIPLLETETSATGQVVAGSYFYSLPNYQRSVKAILYYTPGLTYSGISWTGSLSGMHLNGLNSGYIGFFEDGQLGTIGDGMTTGTILNTVEDVKVLTTTLPAEFGHSAGGAISVVKKTGTNELHGMFSMFGRTRRLQHRKYFDKYRNSQVQPGWDKPPGLIFMQPDANISGPVYIPKLYDGRNRTFFLFAWERLLEKQSKQQQSTVPTPAMLEGDFRFPDANGNFIGQPIYDPRTTRFENGEWFRDPFPNNIVPRSAWSKVAENLVSMKPYLDPNVPGSMTTTGPSGNIMTGPMKLVVWDNYSTRFDQQFSSNLKGYGSWTFNQRWERQPPWTIRNELFDTSLDKTTTRQNTASLGATWIISPTVINETRLGYYRYDSRRVSPAYMQDFASLLGIPGLPPDTMPQIWAASGTTGFTENLNHASPNRNLREVITLKTDTTKVHGTHAFKWGYELLRYRRNQWDVGNPSGSFSYTGTSGLRTNGTNLPNTGNWFAGFLVGAVSSVSFDRRINSSLPRVWQNSFYVQDDWKVTPTLTLNIGIRYSVESPPQDKYGLISIWDPDAIDTSVYTNYTCPAGGCKGAWTFPKGAKAYNTDWNNWDPRFGLAWHPTDKLVIRTGFALTHIDMRDGFLYQDELMTESTSISQAPGNPTPLFFLDQGPGPIIYPARRADGSVPWRGNPGGRSANLVDPNLQAAYTMSWNFGVQYQVHRDYMVEVQYKGSSQVANSGSYNMNSRPWAMIPNPNGEGWLNLDLPENAAFRNSWLNNPQVSRPWNQWGNISYYGNNGHLTHHEGTVKVEKRMSQGLNFLAFYTLQKTIDGNSWGTQYVDWRLNKGRSDWDQRHNFTGTMNYEIPIGRGRRWLNRGGWVNTLIGGFNFVWTYTINSGDPVGMDISGANAQYYPSWMGTYGNVILHQVPKLRDNWQDLGPDRFNQNNQNSMVDCGAFVVGVGNGCFSYRPSFTQGTNGRNLWDRQRIIAAAMSAAKEVPIKERVTFQFRFDFQNPFKWYNWGDPNTTLDIRSAANARSFGTTGVGAEATTAAYGGLPLMNITLALKW